MAGTATLNVRMPEHMKERGMQVLEREGVSVSEVVRDLFCELEATQELPSFVKQKSSLRNGADEGRRSAMRSMIGILPADLTVDEARENRLQRKCQPGVRA